MSEKKPEIINSKFNLRKFFLPVYVVWALVIPTMLIFLNGYTKAPYDSGLSQVTKYINWGRVPSMYALFGFAYPLTIVTFEGFFISFSKVLGFTGFADAWDNLSNVDPVIKGKAQRSVIALILLTLITIGPIIHLILAFIYHKKFIEKKENKVIKWTDYLFGFI